MQKAFIRWDVSFMAVKCISFRKKDMDVKQYLDSLPNASQYIIELVRKDMQNKGEDLEQRIRKIVQELIGNMPAQTQTDSELRGAIEDLFEL